MTKLILLSLSVALLCGLAAGATASSVSITSSAFNSTPVLVFDSTNTTDTDWASIPYTGVTFSADTTNSTVYAWAATVASNAITTITKRKLNATIISWGNDTTEASSLGDSQITGLSIACIKSPVFASGPGYLGIATVGPDTTATPAQQVWLTVASTSGSTATTTQITATTADTTSASTDYNIGSLWYEDGYFYITYVTVAGVISGSTTYSETTVTIQSIGAPNASLLYTAPGTVVVSTLTNSLSGYSRGSATTATWAYAGGSNYTGSTNVYVLYKDSTNAKTYVTPVTRSSGTAGTAVLLETDTAGTLVYQPAGVFYSNYTYGVGLSNASTSNSATTYALTIFSNASWTTGVDSGMSFSNANGALTVSGTLLGTGYLLIASYPTASSGMGYAGMSYYANGTANGTTISIGAVLGDTALFTDANGALWFGYASYDSSQSSPYPVYQGYLGELEGQLFPSTSTSAGKILASLSAFLVMLLAAVLAF